MTLEILTLLALIATFLAALRVAWKYNNPRR